MTSRQQEPVTDNRLNTKGQGAHETFTYGLVSADCRQNTDGIVVVFTMEYPRIWTGPNMKLLLQRVDKWASDRERRSKWIEME